MQPIEPMEIGLVFWAEEDVQPVLRQLNSLDIRAGQIGMPPNLCSKSVLNDWVDGLSASQVRITSVVCSYTGEDYSNLECIHNTVGFTTKSMRNDRIARTKVVSDFAHSAGISAVSCHIGFIPDNPREAVYGDLRDLVRLLCDYCGNHDQDFVLETGQESADVLLAFIHNVDRRNLKVNFDPANMIMYQAGDPLVALNTLSRHVISVHCKDARSPVAGNTRFLGEECTLGDGEVNFPAFLQELKKIGYQGVLSIEREESIADVRVADIRTGISRLKEWKRMLK